MKRATKVLDNAPASEGDLSVMEQPMPTQPNANIAIPKLTGKNYLNWKSIMTDLIILRGFDKVVFKKEDHAMNNLHAKLLIKSALDETHLAEVREYTQAHEIWRHLSRMCIGTNSSDIAMLVRKFYGYKHMPGDNMATHLEKLSNMREQLKDVDQAPTNEVFIDRILQTLPSDYDRLKYNWDFMHSSQRTTQELKARILAIEEKTKQERPIREQQAFLIRRQQNGPSKGKSGDRPRGRIEDLKKRTNCAKCGHRGHWAKECKTKPENYVKQPSQSSNEKNPDVVFVADHSSSKLFNVSNSGSILKDKWIADSGATAHICSNRSWFSDLKPLNPPRALAVGDDRTTDIIGTGTVNIVSQVGDNQVQAMIKDVLLVPELSTNLISIGKLDEKGFTSTFSDGKITLNKTGKPVAQGSRMGNNLWLMDIKAANFRPEQALYVQTKRTLDEWHQVLGHAGKDRISQAIKDHNLQIASDNNDQEANCSDCPPGKAKHSSHPSLTHRAETVGEC